MNFTTILEKLINRKDLDSNEARFSFQEIINGRVPATQIAAFLTALRIKGETTKEIFEFVKIMQESAVLLDTNIQNIVDTAGTGGDGNCTFNISTCAALVACGAGVKIAKHGNRSVSSKSGSADVLEELGINIQITKETAEKQLEEIGITFLFAPLFHPAMKSVTLVRKELGFKTVFNILGPLTSPAGAKRQLIGVYDKTVIKKLAEVAQLLGNKKTLLVTSNMDEISNSQDTEIYEVTNDVIKNYTISPEDFGFKKNPIETLQIKDKTESARIIMDVLKGNSSSARDVVLLNAGAAIYVSGMASTITHGIKLAEKSIDSESALEKLNQLRGTHGYS